MFGFVKVHKLVYDPTHPASVERAVRNMFIIFEDDCEVQTQPGMLRSPFANGEAWQITRCFACDISANGNMSADDYIYVH